MTVHSAFLQCTSKSKGWKNQFVRLMEIHISGFHAAEMDKWRTTEIFWESMGHGEWEREREREREGERASGSEERQDLRRPVAITIFFDIGQTMFRDHGDVFLSERKHQHSKARMTVKNCAILFSKLLKMVGDCRAQRLHSRFQPRHPGFDYYVWPKSLSYMTRESITGHRSASLREKCKFKKMLKYAFVS